MTQLKKARKKHLLKPSERRHFNSLMSENKSGEAYAYAKNTTQARMLMNAVNKIDAIESTPKRRTPVTSTCSVDGEFGSQWSRNSMIATARDLVLNFSLARGLIQTHINNVVGSGPRLQFETDDNAFNERAEKNFKAWGQRCDTRGVLTWGPYVRMIERRTTVDGDLGIILAKGQKLQGIEADRIANPPEAGASNPDWVFGVKVSDILKPLAYGVYSRGDANSCSGVRSSDYRTTVPARNFIHSFDPDRYDQVRGISALISAINDLQDTREALEAVKGCIKIENILALVMKMKPTGSTTVDPLGLLTDFPINNAAGNEETRREVKIEQGVNTINVDIDEDVTAVQRQAPGNQFDSYMMFMIRLIAMALDMPLEIAFHFYTRGSFSSLKGAIGQYHAAVNIRRSRLEQQVLNRIAAWVTEGSIRRWVIEEAKGVPIDKRKGLEPPKDGESVRAFSWSWDQLAFLEPDKQIKADIEAYKLGVTSLKAIAGKRGQDITDIRKQLAEEQKEAEEMATEEGVPIQIFLPDILDPGQIGAGDNTSDDNNGDNDE